mmetsp:Transcript_15632/g.32999  ORF Transcript_15632/g.32999 Transcript_15632/m.32999 type:complete len:279 (+) Transcript_15632:349-1185(+)
MVPSFSSSPVFRSSHSFWNASYSSRNCRRNRRAPFHHRRPRSNPESVQTSPQLFLTQFLRVHSKESTSRIFPMMDLVLATMFQKSNEIRAPLLPFQTNDLFPKMLLHERFHRLHRDVQRPAAPHQRGNEAQPEPGHLPHGQQARSFPLRDDAPEHLQVGRFVLHVRRTEFQHVLVVLLVGSVSVSHARSSSRSQGEGGERPAINEHGARLAGEVGAHFPIEPVPASGRVEVRSLGVVVGEAAVAGGGDSSPRRGCLGGYPCVRELVSNGLEVEGGRRR